MSYPKLETIPFETITKVVKNCTTIKKKEKIVTAKLVFTIFLKFQTIKKVWNLLNQ